VGSETIRSKVLNGQRINQQEALWLLEESDLTFLQEMAEVRRKAVADDRVYFQHNLNINHTNECINECALCAFYRDPGEGYAMSVDEIRELVASAAARGAGEVHIVGGLNPELGFDYYLDVLRAIKGVDAGIFVQGFTAVEVDYMARLSGLPLDEVLRRLKAAGLGSIPGGGAEIFHPAVRTVVCKNKISGERWLEVMECAHKVGVPSNATMLYGHVETGAHIVDHLSQLRQLQDRTGGFQAFVPIPFFGLNTGIEGMRTETFGELDMRVLGVARVFLDNFSHLKSLWTFYGYKACQVGLEFGADDIGSTYYDELIVHSAGADTPKGVSTAEMVHLIEEIGRIPTEVYSNYEAVAGGLHSDEVVTDSAPGDEAREQLEAKISRGERLTFEEGLSLYEQPLWWLGRMAHGVRLSKLPELQATFIVDRVINTTNVCRNACSFCGFYTGKDDDEAFLLSKDEVLTRVDEMVGIGGTQVLIQGGLNPDADLAYYCKLFSAIRARHSGVVIHSLSPPELAYLAELEQCSVEETLGRLKRAGLDSLPGGGAEIFHPTVRKAVSPSKISGAKWLDVMRTAHSQGLRTTATMMFGAEELPEHRVAHLDELRKLQDETGGFRAFIPWTFSPGNTRLKHVLPAGGAEYLRTLAVARIYLDNFDHIGSGWLTEGMKVAQLGLKFGADDMGGVLMEEKVLRETGVTTTTNIDELKDVIRYSGFRAAKRNTAYEVLEDLCDPS